MTGIPLFSVEDQLRLRDQRTSTPNFLEIKTPISKRKPAAAHPILAGYIINTFYFTLLGFEKAILKRLQKPAAAHPIFLTSIIPHISPLCQSPIPFAVDLCYNGHVVNSQISLFHTEGGEFPLSELEILVSFIVSVAAGIATHYICKWLDRHK